MTGRPTAYSYSSETGFDRTGYVRQRWVGAIDVHGMLGEIGSWHVGCKNEEWSGGAVGFAVDQGWVTTRKHYAPAIPDGVDAYELTDQGIEVYRWAYGSHAAARAEASREWYRRSAAAWLKTQCRWCAADFADHKALGNHLSECNLRP